MSGAYTAEGHPKVGVQTDMIDIPATIALGASQSGAIDLGEHVVPVKLFIPAAVDGNEISFQGSVDGAGTYGAIYDRNNLEAKLTGIAANQERETPDALGGSRFIKLTTLLNGVAQNQTAARTFTIRVASV
jgi:hypothetical protein